MSNTLYKNPRHCGEMLAFSETPGCVVSISKEDMNQDIELVYEDPDVFENSLEDHAEG